MKTNSLPTVLAIGGSDPSGGAGIQADIKTIEANGCHALSVITAITSQNLSEVRDIIHIPPSHLKSQIVTLFDEFDIDIVKIGMIGSVENLKVLIDIIDKYDLRVVVDPIIRSSSGSSLIEKETLRLLKNELFKRAFLVTPNISEAKTLSGIDIKNLDDMKKACKSLDAKNILLKGSHLDSDEIVDLLYSEDRFYQYAHERIDIKNPRGTGCTLSSAIAANLAHKNSLFHSIENGISYLLQTLQSGYRYNSKASLLNHSTLSDRSVYV